VAPNGLKIRSTDSLGRCATNAKLNSLHWHSCSLCDALLTCACANRRQHDDMGQERRLLCLKCMKLEELLEALVGEQKVSEHAA